MANYLSLEEAAKELGISTERLVELRSQGQVRGFRDGASWKFPDNEIERLKDDMDALAGGSNVDLGGEDLQPGSGSDVNLVPAEGEGSDVAVVASDSDLDFESSEDLLEIDSGELQLQDPAILHDSAQLDLAIEPNAGSTGPVTDEELKEISESHPDVLAPGGSGVDLGSEGNDLNLESESDLSFKGPASDDDSGEAVLGGAESDLDALGSDASPSAGGASSLELMDSLDEPEGGSAAGARGSDVLSELDLLSAEQEGSGLISGR